MKRLLFLVAALSCVMAGFADKKETVTTKSAPATQPSENIEKQTEIIHVYMDTTYTYTSRTVRNDITPAEDTAFTRKGHYIQALLGAGYSSLGYNFKDLVDARNAGGFNYLAQFNYAYYFHENWGVMVGLEFERMASTAVLNGYKTWYWRGDSDDGEEYDHVVKMNNWKEKQISYILGLPVGIQCQFPIADMPNVSHRNDKIRLYADLGAKVNYVLANQYRLVSGSISHMGQYYLWDLQLDEEIGTDLDFYTESVGEAAWTTERKKLDLNSISVDGMADLGVMIPLAEHLDLMVGLYANVTFNNLRKPGEPLQGMADATGTNEGYSPDLGWRNYQWQEMYGADNAYREHTFMDDYVGIVNTSQVKALRPWDIGIKVGISWNAPAKPAKKYENLVLCDTTFSLSRREEVETVSVAAKKINEIMKKSVIWFDFDSDKPRLEPADVVDKIAEVLLEHPEQMVLVYGHASKEGSLTYNQRLSERRANSIVKLLKAKGVPEKQIVSKGFSYTQQYDDSENPYHNIELDRRVEIIPVFEKDREK